MSNYTEESLLLTENGPITGLAALRECSGAALAGMSAPRTYEIAVDDLRVEGEAALPIWRGTTEQAEMPFAVDMFVIEDGKIAIQTFAAKIEPD